MSRIGPGPSENARALGWPENCRYLDSSNLKKYRVMEVLDNRSAADAAVRDSRQQPVAPVMSVGEWMLTLLILGFAAGEHHHAVRLGVRRRHESDESQLLQSVADLDRDRYRALCVLLLVDYGIVRSDPVADRRQARKTACFRWACLPRFRSWARVRARVTMTGGNGSTVRGGNRCDLRSRNVEGAV